MFLVVGNSLPVLKVRELSLLLQIVDKHHQVGCRREETFLLSDEAIDFEEEEPEQGDREKLVFVHIEIGVQKVSQEVLSARVVVLESHLEDHAIVLWT